ncbi:STAS domain-containing protein [Halobacillus rhizosphaerae]|uniref:STAS domain-containing protein n=1 Tax=Halobacillus rhizosphaerae TaxID=3064889 RepID=UPI00398A79CC
MDHSAPVQFFQEKLVHNTELLSNRLLKTFETRYPESALLSSIKQDEALIIELFETIPGILTNQSFSKKEAVNWGGKVGTLFISRGSSLNEAMEYINLYKEVLWSYMIEQTNHTDYTFKEVMEVITRIDYLFNHMIYGYSLAYAKENTRVLKTYEDKYLKLSTPIVPIKDNAAILPLAGEIDDLRAAVILEETLRAAHRLDLDFLVIDLSGVYAFNEDFLDHFHQLMDGLQLLGIIPILSGIRPDLSMNAVKKGMLGQPEQPKVHACSTLKQALELIEQMNQ